MSASENGYINKASNTMLRLCAEKDNPETVSGQGRILSRNTRDCNKFCVN